MARKTTKKNESVEQYTHHESKRPNNPPVGLVTPAMDPDQPSKKYSFDSRLNPQLQWSGKQENSEFEVETVSLHVHERIDPSTTLEKAFKPQQHSQQTMFNFFDSDENNPPLRDAIEFYKHDQNWSNRLIAGDSLLVINSLLEKEGMEGKVQMIYIDPPYGIKYGSNFQPFVNKQNVTDGKDEDLTQEPETIKAFRDTWELGIHSYLSYLRNRLKLTKKLLNDSGSCFVQISVENLHHVKEILDEIFGSQNFISIIDFRTRGVITSVFLPQVNDYILWYAKDKIKTKFHKIFVEKTLDSNSRYNWVEFKDGRRRSLTIEEKKNPDHLPKDSKIFIPDKLSAMAYSNSTHYEYEFEGKKFIPAKGRSWQTNITGMNNIKKSNRLIAPANTLCYVRYFSDYPVSELNNIWYDTQGELGKIFGVQTSTKVISRCMLMTTDPGDLVVDPTCGSGTTAYVAEQWGRRWITCDTSRIAITLAKQRLITSVFNYYSLRHPENGLSQGFKYEKVSHITLGSIANNEPLTEEIRYDKPEIDKNRVRVTGPFTMEAVPSPIVKSMDVLSEELKHKEINGHNIKTSLQQQWRDELFKTGIRGKNSQKIEFTRVESHPATKWLHADAETKEKNPKRTMVSFGPEHAPLEQRQVENAIEEAQMLVPKPQVIIFAAMQFDPEAAKDIDELNWPGVTILKIEMNKDLLTNDLKKKRSSNESFWLVGQPDVKLKSKNDKFIITVNGFDYYNTNTGEIDSGNSNKITMWMLDTDYDGRSIYPQQIFFPMEGKTGGWNKLAKTLQSQIDEGLIAKYQGTESIPFEAGPNKRAAVKIIDDRGIESLKIIRLE